jgi:2,4-dienoyl-CoA reductase-like NADH-dependent reductase (Old Yellow Enzyme family)
MAPLSFPRVASLKTAAAFRTHLDANHIALGFDETVEVGPRSPLAQPLEIEGVSVGNRFCILPMEGWDGTRDGEPSDLTRRRWRNFGASGAKLIWGGEAVAVRPDGRANPNQLMITDATAPTIASLRDELVTAHRARFGSGADADLFVGLQLTHSGRFSRPDVWDRPAPLAACANPIMDRRYPEPARVLDDAGIDRLVDDFVRAARLAAGAGFQFVDLKHCHGYFGHELLGARSRAGRYGGAFEHRTRFLAQLIQATRDAAPELVIGVRLSAFDFVPYGKTAGGAGAPEPGVTAAIDGFGVVHDDRLEPALDEAHALLTLLRSLGVRWICITGGSPYYCPHVQRPALFPPLDGYEPPEDPLRGVARQIQATALLKAAHPGLVFVGSAYSYLQEWLPHVAQHNVRCNLTDFVGLGRVVLAYPDLPSDVINGRPLRRGSLCRTFSDCTTGPRMGFVSGCYPLDAFYTARAEAEPVKRARAHSRSHS